MRSEITPGGIAERALRRSTSKAELAKDEAYGYDSAARSKEPKPSERFGWEVTVTSRPKWIRILRSHIGPKPMIYSLAVVLSSCGPSIAYTPVMYEPFTRDLRNSLSLTRPQVACLQYYLSHEVTLERELHEGDFQIQSGRLERRHGHVYHVVQFPAHAPAILRPTSAIQPETVGAQFDNSQPGPLYFAVTSASAGKYDLAIYVHNGEFRTRFAGSEFTVTNGASAYLQLRVADKSAKKTVADSYNGLTLEQAAKSPVPVGVKTIGRILPAPNMDSCVAMETDNLAVEHAKLVTGCTEALSNCVALAQDYEWRNDVYSVRGMADLDALCLRKDGQACFVSDRQSEFALQTSCNAGIAVACTMLGDVQDISLRQTSYARACSLGDIAGCAKGNN